MRCAIVGGGAAGLATAYYLSSNHEVVLFEKQDTLGGNVRTLGLNEPSSPTLSHLGIDCGVIEFMANKSPCLTSLLNALAVPTEVIVGGSTSFFPEQGRSLHLPRAINRMAHLPDRIPYYLRLLPALARFSPALMRYWQREDGVAMGAVFGDDAMSRWMKGLIMYGYSMPYAAIDQFPFELARETLKRVMIDIKWMRIPGGAYSYMQKIVAQAQIDIRKGSKGLRVRRSDTTVTVSTKGSEQTFDCIVFATPPHEILPMLADPTPLEINNLTNWRKNVAETVIHTDVSLYAGRLFPEMTEFDIFELANGTDAGYNAYLNRLLGLPTNEGTQYFLAFNLEARILPQKILHRSTHETTFFSAKTDTRSELRRANGSGQTYYAGAYLYDGLHEGAIESACAVVDAIKSATPENK